MAALSTARTAAGVTAPLPGAAAAAGAAPAGGACAGAAAGPRRARARARGRWAGCGGTQEIPSPAVGDRVRSVARRRPRHWRGTSMLHPTERSLGVRVSVRISVRISVRACVCAWLQQCRLEHSDPPSAPAAGAGASSAHASSSPSVTARACICMRVGQSVASVQSRDGVPRSAAPRRARAHTACMGPADSVGLLTVCARVQAAAVAAEVARSQPGAAGDPALQGAAMAGAPIKFQRDNASL